MGADPLMAGNSQRRGRTTGAGKKTATAGTGGKNRRSLAGRGATPAAANRPGHPAQRKAAAEAKARAEQEARQRRYAQDAQRDREARLAREAAEQADAPAPETSSPRSASFTRTCATTTRSSAPRGDRRGPDRLVGSHGQVSPGSKVQG